MRYKSRRVAFVPDAKYFRPMGIPSKCLDEVILSVEEVEALRLKDMEHLEQEEGAEKMNVSRPTFQRILTSARQKMAEALLKGKSIRIEGGHFNIAPAQFRIDCPFKGHHSWCKNCPRIVHSDHKEHMVTTKASVETPVIQ